jgi:hypothetical protein
MAVRRTCRRRDQTGSDGAAAKDRTEWLPPVSSRGVIAAGNQFRRGSSTVVVLRVQDTDRHFDLISITYLYILRAWSMQQERHARRLDSARAAGPGAHGALAGRTRPDPVGQPTHTRAGLGQGPRRRTCRGPSCHTMPSERAVNAMGADVEDSPQRTTAQPAPHLHRSMTRTLRVSRANYPGHQYF